MTNRELWQNIMFYKGHDRMPVMHWTEWTETKKRWIKEGLPAKTPDDVDETIHKYFQTIPMWSWIGANVGLYPAFSEEIIEETEEYKIFKDGEGVIQKSWKKRSNIPHYIDFTFKTAKDWDIYKKKLQPDSNRIPHNIDEIIKNTESSGLPIVFGTSSMMGWTRDWLGVENLAYFMYDHQDVFTDIVDTFSDLTCWAIDQIFPKMKIKPDIGFGWEDICGRSGPFVSPSIFRKCVAPGYRKIRNKLESYGVHLLGIDSDGDIKALIGEWLDSGVNVFFPVEIGTWNADSMEYRKKYGREFRVIGGFNKLVLEKTHKEIDEEIERRIPIMKDGGFIILPDHLMTPDTPLENYKYYLDRIRNLRF